MKKTINIKSTKLLTESSIKVGDVDYEKKLRRRVVDLQRARDMATAAKQRAESNGQSDLAQKLEDKIVELDDLLANYNVDTIDDDEGGSSGSASGSSSKGNGSGSENSKKNDSEEDPDEGENENSENEDNGKSKKGNKKDGDDEGDGGDSETEDDSDEDGDDGSGKKKDSDSDESDKGDKGDSEEDDEDDTDGDDSTEGGNGKSKKKDDDSDDKGGDGDTEGDDSDEGGNEDSDTENGDGNGEDEDESSDSDGDSGGSKGSKSNKSDAGDTDGDDSDEDNSDDDGDSGNDSQNQSDGKSAQSKTKPSLDPNDSNSNSNAQPEFKNPFADEEDIPGGLGSMSMGGEPPRDATTDETIELLKTLKGEGREGAKDALRDLIARRKAAQGGAVESFRGTGNASLTEAVKNVRDMTDDEFGDYINGVYDIIDQAEAVDYVDDIEERKKKIGQWSTDPVAIQELQAEDNLELQKDYQKKKARDAAKAKYSKMGTLDDFQMNFYSAINNQIETIRQEYQSYDEINAEYESEDIVMKADLEKELPAEAIPIVDVYFDVSGSWEDTDIEIGEAAIASVKVFEDQGELVLNIFYFSNDVDNVSMQHCRDTYGQGTHGWPKILQNIKATGAKNVLIMTDNDIELLNGSGYGAADCGSLKVEGCVWYLWKNGESSPTCLRKLTGNQGTYQFSFRA